MTTDRESSFADSPMRIIGYDMARDTARQVYEASRTGPWDIDVVELHDCFTANELITYEALGLTPDVRVARYSAFFVELDKKLQDDIIRRTVQPL